MSKTQNFLLKTSHGDVTNLSKVLTLKKLLMDLDQITNEMNCNRQKVLILNRKKNEI